ncbi:hypothetical protein [Kutzneria sp. NPDC051319]|uniref:hypothetical protein n=1 Tax=Kutzneria sp. NPDC051319 TaxID=3155047 RepID=UPI00341ED4D9
MDTEDEELLALLRAEVSEQLPPPVHTALDDVVRRGRRRLRARRLGATLGVVAVVAGVGITASVLRSSLSGGMPANQLAAASTSSGSPTTTLSGWVSTAHSNSKDCSNVLSVPGEPKADPVSADKLSDTLLRALMKIASPGTRLKITRSTAAEKPSSGDGLLASTWADVIDAGGGGSVYVEARGYTGTATQAADSEQFVNGGCTAPLRRTLSDGTVMQLYAETKYDPGHPSQALRVYTPAHRLYVITAEGFSSADWTKVPGEPGTLAVPDGAGRHSLPLSETQLTAIGEAIAGTG